MPAVLTHKAVMLLASQRVRRIEEILQGKLDDPEQTVTSLDRQLLAIAKETSRIFTSEPRPHTTLPGVPFTTPANQDSDRYPVSQYSVLGAMGPDLTAYSHLLAPEQDWVHKMLHKGTPDSNRELVNAQSTDFILIFWRKVNELIATTITDGDKKEALLNKMRAYVLGHLCNIATHVVINPYINNYQWQESPQNLFKLRAEIEGQMDAMVARNILQRDSTRAGQYWDAWWPAEKLPEQFYGAYKEALQEVYKTAGNWRAGYAGFLSDKNNTPLPEPTEDFIRDGYKILRNPIIKRDYGYGYWGWWGWLGLLVIPALALPLVIAALPKGKNIFLKDENKRNERAWLEFLSAPMLLGLPASIGYAILNHPYSGGNKTGFWLGIAGTIISGLSGIALIATLMVDTLPPGFSWPVLFAIPFMISIIQTITGISGVQGFFNAGIKTPSLTRFLFGLPSVLLLAFLVIFGIFPSLLFPDTNANTPFASVGFWIAFVLWSALWLVAWFVLPPHIREANKLPENSENNILNRRFISLFDEGTLHHDADLESKGIPSQVYPSGRRKLVKLWWTGSGDLYIRSDRYQLQFSASEDGSDAQIIPAPIAPVNLQEYMDYLKDTVVQPGSSDTGKLLWSMAYNDQQDYVLPAGAIFADHGDTEEGREAHDQEAAKFTKLGSSEEDSDYHLYHAYKAAQAVRYGEKGAVPPERNLGSSTPISNVAEEEGYEFLHNPEAAEATDSLMSYAADFGAILSMAATTHMVDNLKDSDNNKVNKVYQVFRNWNLDRRRVNEWRMLVAGNALSEKGPSRSGYDHMMPGGTLRPANHESWQEALLKSSQAAFDEGEQTARQLGWVKVLREWMDVSSSRGQGSLETRPMKPGNPDNQALSRAMAYLFDLPDPTLAEEASS